MLLDVERESKKEPTIKPPPLRMENLTNSSLILLQRPKSLPNTPSPPMKPLQPKQSPCVPLLPLKRNTSLEEQQRKKLPHQTMQAYLLPPEISNLLDTTLLENLKTLLKHATFLLQEQQAPEMELQTQ